MRKAILSVFLLSGLASPAMAQDMGTAQDQAEEKNPDKLLSQFSFGSAVTDDAYSVPKVAIKTYRFSAGIGKGEWEFNLFNSVPAISINSADSEAYFRNDLVRQLGGIVNVSLGKVGYIGAGKNPGLEDVKGGRFEFKVGGKAVDVLSGESGNRKLVPVFQSSLDLQYMIPLFRPREKGETANRNRDDVVGNLSFRVIGAFLAVASTDVFDDYYSTRTGIPPDPKIMVATFDVSFFVTNELYINGGYSVTNQKEIKSVPFLSISYGKSGF